MEKRKLNLGNVLSLVVFFIVICPPAYDFADSFRVFVTDFQAAQKRFSVLQDENGRMLDEIVSLQAKQSLYKKQDPDFDYPDQLQNVFTAMVVLSEQQQKIMEQIAAIEKQNQVIPLPEAVEKTVESKVQPKKPQIYRRLFF